LSLSLSANGFESERGMAQVEEFLKRFAGNLFTLPFTRDCFL